MENLKDNKVEREELSINDFTKNKTTIKVIFLLAIFGFLLYKTYNYFGLIGYREMWTICIDYINQGTIWGGQPRCEGGILPLYIIWILDSLVGRENIQIATSIFITIVSSIFLWIFLKVTKKELDYNDWFWPTLFFGLFVYMNAVINIETILSSLFFFTAFYFLFYSEREYKYYLTGVFIFLSLISKFNAIVHAAFLLFWYTKRYGLWNFKDKKIKIAKNKIKETIINNTKILLPIFLGFIGMKHFFKNFWEYTFLVFRNQDAGLSTIETLKAMIFFNVYEINIAYLLLLILVIVGTYQFYEERKFYALMSGPLLFLSMFFIAQSFGFGFAAGLKYWTVIFPFSALMFIRMKQTWTTMPKKQIYQSIIILFCIFPGLYISVFQMTDDLSYVDSLNFVHQSTNDWKEKDTFIKEIHYGYSIVPQQERRILMEHQPISMKKMLISLGSNIPFDNIDLLSRRHMESHPDIYGFTRFQELFGEELIYNPNDQELTEKEKEVINNIEAGIYSLIVFGPPEWEISERIISNVNNETLAQYCQVLVPNNVWLTNEGWHFSYFFFSDYSHCEQLLQGMYGYYTQNYKSICQKDQASALIITQVMQQNGVEFTEMCTSGENGLLEIKQSRGIRTRELLLMFILVLLPFCLWFTKKILTTKNKDNKEK